MTEQSVRNLADREAIRESLFRYCRGLDRMDKAMAYGVFHQDCSVDYHGIFTGSGHDFVDWVWRSHQGMERHSHQVSNLLIQLDGDKASSEACLSLVLWTVPDEQGQQHEMLVRGRYLDRWEKREGRWAIVRREYVQDLQSDRQLQRGFVSEQSTRDTDDASWRFLAPAQESGK